MTDKTIDDYIDNPDDLPDDPDAIERLTAELGGEGDIASGKTEDETEDADGSNATDQETADKLSKENTGESGEKAEDTNYSDDKADSQAGDKPTDDSEGNDDRSGEDDGVVLTRNGKRTIPYSVLAGSRREVEAYKERSSTLEDENRRLREQLATKTTHQQDGGEKPPADDAAAGDDNSSAEEAEFKRLYGLSIDDYREEYDDTQADMFLAQIRENLALKDQLDNLDQDRQSREEADKRIVAQRSQDIIDTIPVLVDWQQNNPIMWKAAMAADEAMRNDPEFSDLSPEERFSKVAETLSGGKTHTPAAETTPKDSEKAVSSAVDKNPVIPTSMSEFPGGGEAVDQTELDRLGNMSASELDKLMDDPRMAEAALANL